MLTADIDSQRSRAALAAVAELKAGMVVGLGTGDTAARAIRALGAARLGVACVATSEAAAALARQVGLDVRAPDDVGVIDVTIDGADEVDDDLRLLKGAGGALTREKLVARASRRLIIVVDADKRVLRLGEKRALPVEILQFGRRWTEARLADLGLQPRLREGFVTDNGGVICDCVVPADVVALAQALDGMSGVLEHGLFLTEAATVYVGRPDTVEKMQR